MQHPMHYAELMPDKPAYIMAESRAVVTYGELAEQSRQGAHVFIISGGVNIYPQEIENILISHPDVDDVAVFGIPCEEFGQQVKAVVQPRKGADSPDQLEVDLIAWCRERMSNIKVPKSISFDPALPRLDNGKLYKQEIADAHQNGVAA